MESTVFSLRLDGELLERLRGHAAKRGMSVQDYVVRTLIREDFDERFKTAVDETERFYGKQGEHEEAVAPQGVAPHAPHIRPSAGIA